MANQYCVILFAALVNAYKNTLALYALVVLEQNEELSIATLLEEIWQLFEQFKDIDMTELPSGPQPLQAIQH